MVNPETEFIKQQIELLKQQYEEETKADRFFEAEEEVNYLKEFQDFEKPPVVPEEVAQTEFYRPNPAAFQKRINDNPYAVDVGFSSLQNPVYSKLDEFPNLMNTRANSQFYNPHASMNSRAEYRPPAKPFAQQLNAVVLERAHEREKRGTLDDLVLKAGLLGPAKAGQASQMGVSRPSTFMFGSFQPPTAGQAAPQPAASYHRLYDFIREPEQVGRGQQAYEPAKVGQFTNKAANLEIIKYNIEKLGGIESTIGRMEPSLQTFELRNIEKNLEAVNQPAVHPRYFDPSRDLGAGAGPAFANTSLPRARSTGVFPYGGASGPVDPKEAGQFQRSYQANPDLSNYPCKRR